MSKSGLRQSFAKNPFSFLSPAEPVALPFLLHKTPKIAAHPFPLRKAVLYTIIGLLWLLFGVFERDPWKPDETLLAGFIVAAQGGGGVAGIAQVADDFGLSNHSGFYLTLLVAASALLSALSGMSWLSPVAGAQALNLLLLLGGAVCLWRAVALHYGARAGWLALLLLLGCFGFMVRAHQLNFGAPAFFGMAMATLAAAALTAPARRDNQAFAGGLLSAGGAVFLLLTCGWLYAAVALAALSVIRRDQLAAGIVAASVFLPVAFIMRADIAGNALADGNAALRVVEALRVAAWSLLPLLPLALYGLWRNRRERLDRLSRYCLFAVAGGALAFALYGAQEDDYYFLLAPLALLAARQLIRLPDGAASVMDFFAALIIGLCVIGGLWSVWLSLLWQLPPLSGMMAELFPGYALPPPGAGAGIGVAVAALLTIGWVVLLCNFGRSNERAIVNWSGGVTLVWVVFNLLLLGYVESGKSYRAPAMAALAVINDSNIGDTAVTAGGESAACLYAPAAVVDNHWRAQLVYFGVALGDSNCAYHLNLSPAGALMHIARNEKEFGYYLHARF